MVLDAVSNFVRGTSDAAIAIGDTTISVADASIFPDPATDGEFNVVIWNASNFPRPDQDANVEIVRVTARDTGSNELTVTRAQEMTSAAAHPDGSAIHLSPTAKMFSDIESTFADFWDADAQQLTGDVNNTNTTTESLEAGLVSTERSHTEQVPTFDVTTYGAEGDGETDDHDAIQDAIDACEAAGGGVVYFPNSHYAWQDTILVGDNCHLDFDWSTVTGLRDGVEDGHALISNKGFDEDGHGGAANWSVRNIIIDSPDTNGITTAHSGEAEIHNVIGESILDHYVDIAGSLDILTSNLWVREAGTRFNQPFQWDSLPEDGGANNVIVDGEPVEPNYDGTINEGCSLKGARIRPENNTPDSSIHIHRDGHGDYVIEDVVIENGGDGILADPDIEFGDVQISNVKVKDSGRVIRFRDPAGQRGHLQLSNVIGVNVGGTTIFCDNHKSVELDNVVLEDCEGFAAYMSENTPHVHLSNIVIDGHENQGIIVRGDAKAVVTNTTIKDTGGAAILIEDDVELQFGGLVFDNVSSETQVNDNAEIVTFNSS